jgi:ribosomal-protein-alanine N-acetyltransferase
VNELRLPYLVVPMALEDIDQVSAIDHVAFSTPWSVNAFRYEVTQNEMAHYYVVVPRDSPPSVVAGDGWLGWLRRWFTAVPSSRFILGFGGFWLMVNEAHVSTIAVRPGFRRRGIGELLMVKMIEEAIALRAVQVTLEVRESNSSARQLYDKYGFVVTGRRRAYYADNREDALIMTVEGVLTPAYQQTFARLKAALYRRLTATATS